MTFRFLAKNFKTFKWEFIFSLAPFLAKSKKSKLQASDVDAKWGNTPIYVHEHLTQERKKLLYLARQRITECNFKYLCTKVGTMYMKKSDSTMPVKITKKLDKLK